MPRVDCEKFYSSAIEMYGITARGLNWHSKESQKLRFDVIFGMLPKDISSFSVADAGCGFGDLFFYLKKKKNAPKEYIGIDSLTDMYEIASNRTGCEIIIADICKDELPHADYYICSGAMNVLSEFETYQFIRNCFLACGKGFLFNILHGNKESETYNYLSTSQIQQIAKELKVDKIIIQDDYLEDDITVLFLKEPQ